MGIRIHVLRFRTVNRNTFNAIKSGRKKIETRAATKRYKNIKKGDTLKFMCGSNSFIKRIKKATFFKTVGGLLKKYKPVDINPKVDTEEKLRKMYYGFPSYREKIRKYGLVAFELK